MNFTENKLRKAIIAKLELEKAYPSVIGGALNLFADRIKWGNDVIELVHDDSSLIWIDTYFFDVDEYDALHSKDELYELTKQLISKLDLESLQDLYDSLCN